MGEIADDMIDGTSCSLCGCYFKDPKKEGFAFTHGYPVYCRDCWEPDCGHGKAEVNTY